MEIVKRFLIFWYFGGKKIRLMFLLEYVESIIYLLVKSMGYVLSETDSIDLEKEQSTILLKLTSEDIREVSEQVKARVDEFKDFFN